MSASFDLIHRPHLCFHSPQDKEHPNKENQGLYLDLVKSPPQLYSKESSPSFAYPVNVPFAHKDYAILNEEASSTRYWTKEKKLRAKWITGLILSILTSPLLLPILSAAYCGYRLHDSYQRGDLDCASKRNKVQQAIANRELNFLRITELYSPEIVKKYRLLDTTDKQDLPQVYEKFRLLHENSLKVKQQKKFDFDNIEVQYDQATGKAISAYHKRRAWIVGKQTLLTIVNIALLAFIIIATVASVVATAPTTQDGEFVFNVMRVTTYPIGWQIRGIGEDIETWRQVNKEYRSKVEPWNNWRKSRKKQVTVAYQQAEVNLQTLFEKTILNRSIETDCPPSESLLFFTTEEEDGKSYPLCNISYERLQLEEAVSIACGHTFNRKSITNWLEKNNICPCCRHSGIEQKDLKNITEQDLKTSPNLVNYKSQSEGMNKGVF